MEEELGIIGKVAGAPISREALLGEDGSAQIVAQAVEGASVTWSPDRTECGS
jgi:hypothetical protein